MSRKPKKYHYIYKTTCKVTGKFYVGMHSSDSLDDGYLGSGKILGYSRKKYGDENHVREILEFCSSRDELKQREKEIVCEELLADPLNINLKYGGEGGGRIWNEEHQLKFAKAGGSVKGKPQSSWKKAHSAFTQSAKFRECILIAQQKAVEAARSLSSNEKRKATMLAREHSKGPKNPNYGSCRITVKKDGVTKRVLLENLNNYVLSGWCQSVPRIRSTRETRATKHKKLQPKCKNEMCSNVLSLKQFLKKNVYCSKSCSNVYRGVAKW